MQSFVHVDITWIRRLSVTSNLTISPYGWCNTFNLVDESEMFYENSVAEYFYYQKTFLKSTIETLRRVKNFLPENTDRLPLKTAQSNAGFQGAVYMEKSQYYACNYILDSCRKEKKQLTLILHSPYETPDSRHRTLHFRYAEFAKLTFDPQFRITDDALLSLDIDEYVN